MILSLSWGTRPYWQEAHTDVFMGERISCLSFALKHSNTTTNERLGGAG